MEKQSTIDKRLEQSGFNSLYRLGLNNQYQGDADRVILVWHENQILPAEQYRKAHFKNIRVDIAICQDPNIQRDQLGKEKSLIYHYNGGSSGGGPPGN